jgi:hypothetical protein
MQISAMADNRRRRPGVSNCQGTGCDQNENLF